MVEKWEEQFEQHTLEKGKRHVLNFHMRNLLEEDGLKTAQAWAEMYFAGKKLGTCQEQMEELEKIITADKILETMKKHFE